MKEINREIASAIIFSKDGKLLMGKKHAEGGGSYADCWHIPGGGIDDGETLIEAVIREVREETGIELSEADLKPLEAVGEGSSKKIDKATGEEVIAHMKFNRFEVHLPVNAEEVVLSSDGEFEKLEWFSREELNEVEQIPGGREFFREMGYMNPVREMSNE